MKFFWINFATAFNYQFTIRIKYTRHGLKNKWSSLIQALTNRVTSIWLQLDHFVESLFRELLLQKSGMNEITHLKKMLQCKESLFMVSYITNCIYDTSRNRVSSWLFFACADKRMLFFVFRVVGERKVIIKTNITICMQIVGPFKWMLSCCNLCMVLSGTIIVAI